MLASFGRVLFAADTPKVILPSSSAGPGDISGSGGQEQDYQRVEVTTQTVTGVVATLARPASYYRTLTAETFWEGGSSSVQVQVWADGGWSHSRQTLPSGAVRHDLTGEDTLLLVRRLRSVQAGPGGRAFLRPGSAHSNL